MTLGRSRDLTRQDPPTARRRELGPKPKLVTNTPPASPPTSVPGQDPDLVYQDATNRVQKATNSKLWIQQQWKKKKKRSKDHDTAFLPFKQDQFYNILLNSN